MELILTGLGSVVIDLENGGGGQRKVGGCSSDMFGLGSGGGGGILKS